jgi:hypothetical protein
VLGQELTPGRHHGRPLDRGLGAADLQVGAAGPDAFDGDEHELPAEPAGPDQEEGGLVVSTSKYTSSS